ncbi:MAG: TonB-dependent receptor plug domain-containing protein [Sphingomonadaceae bacterium]
MPRRGGSAALAVLLAPVLAVPALAQESVDSDAADEASAPVSSPVAKVGESGDRRIYHPADFARFAPRNALDMLQRVPGFNIRGSAEQRGLGQATGNVLFNGARPSSKSDDIGAQLTRIPANAVTRIEILDGAALDTPGLSGEVANVIYDGSSGWSGQFSWIPEVRPHNTDPLLWRGDISVSRTSGPTTMQVALSNANSGRGGADGPTLIVGGDGTVRQLRQERVTSDYDSPKLSAKLTWDPAGPQALNLTAQYQRIYERFREDSLRTGPGQTDELRTVRQRENRWNYEFGGDYSFPLAGGTIKAIGLLRRSYEPFTVDVINRSYAGSPVTGERFSQTGDLGENVARGEFGWSMLGGEWQVAGEAAFNSLDNAAALFTLDPAGQFVEVPFPFGTGGVSEDRYEGSISHSRSLASNLSVQLNFAVEHSTIAQSGVNGLERSFLRPKGKLSLAWKAVSDLDFALSVQRRVLQLSFYDFLARAFIDDGNQNAGNNDLRPQQDWSFEGEVNKSLGPWGKTQLSFIYRDVSDYVDIIPVEGGGESVGNVAKASAAAVISTSTLTFDPIGLKGVRLDGTFVLQRSRLIDPFTGVARQWSGFNNRQANLNLRHDIPASLWAWGVGANHNHVLPRYRSNQTDHRREGPWFVSAFVEHKDVLGMTVRARVGNILGARQYRERIVYSGLRGESAVDFAELRNRRIGPIFTLTVRGNF